MADQQQTGIYLEIKPVLLSSSARTFPQGVLRRKHAYLVYRKADGTTEVIRGGFALDDDDGARVSVETGKTMRESEDRYANGERPGTRPSRRLPVAPDRLDAVWARMRKHAERIGAAEIPYRFDTEPEDPDQTSNSVVRSLLDLENIPLDQALPEGIDRTQMNGIEDNLKEKLPAAEKRRVIRQKANEPEAGGAEALPIGAEVLPLEGEEFDRRAFVASLTQGDGPLEEILLKAPGDLTEGEARQLAKRRLATADADERQALFDFEQAHYEDIYGAGPAARDATGRLIQSAAAKSPNRMPIAALGVDDRPIADTVAAVAEQVADLAQGGDRLDAVRALQRGLNVLIREPWRTPDFNPEVWRERLRRSGREEPYALIAGVRPLKDDGLPGPKTRAALRRAAAAWGRPGVEEGLALGRFDGFARNAEAGGLRTAAETAFAPLFPARAAQPGGPRPEGYGLQMAVNDLGQKTMGGAFRPLKEDGDIGPKTEAAFHDVLRAAGPDRFASQLGKRLGFFGAAGDVADVA